MGYNQFDYPNKTSPTTTLILNKAHLIADDTEDVEFNQSTGLSKGGTRYAESWGAAKTIYPISIICPVTATGTEATYAQLRTFLITTINGAENTFVWTDENAATYTVRMVADRISFENMGAGKRKCSLTLEVQ